MAIEFDCPACETTIRVRDDAAGKKGRCPKCKALLLVPDPGPAEEDSPVTSVAAPVNVETDQGADAPRSPAVIDPNAPFPIVTTPASRPTAVSRRRRRWRAPSKVVAVGAALFGLAAVVASGWYLLRTPEEHLSRTLTGERLSSVVLPPVMIAPPGEDVPNEDVAAVMDVLDLDGLPLKSEYISVTLSAEDGQIQIVVAPGPQSMTVRVPLGRDPKVRAALARHRKAITAAKQAELQRSTADLFRDYAAYLDGGAPMTRLPEYRDQVALNAAVGPVGYAVEAVVGRTPFPCVYEDAEGNCYFFPPEGTRVFRVRGRELGDGTTPLAVEFEVRVVEEM